MSRHGNGAQEDDTAAALGMHRRVDVRAFLSFPPPGSLSPVSVLQLHLIMLLQYVPWCDLWNSSTWELVRYVNWRA